MSVQVADSRRFAFFIIDNEVTDCYKLSSNALLAYIAISRCANNGSCSYSIQFLASKVGMSRATFFRAFPELVEAGLISAESVDGAPTKFTLLPVTKMVRNPSLAETPPVSTGDTPRINQRRVPVSTGDTKNTNNKTEDLFSLTSSEPPKKTLHTEVKEYLNTTYQKRFGVPVTWDASEAKNLSSILAANPAWTLPIFKRLIDNRYASEGVNGERPRIWLSDLGRYLGGPLDKYGNPKQQSSPVVQREVTISERMRALAAGSGR